MFNNIGKIIKKKSLILIQTTLPPGTCDYIIIPTLKKVLEKRKMKLNDINFGYKVMKILFEIDNKLRKKLHAKKKFILSPGWI